MKNLTVNNAKEYINKPIKWRAPADPANAPYMGIAVIKEVNQLERKPIVATTIEGDNLSYTFNEWGAGNSLESPLAYSDSDRYIKFELL